MYTKKNKTNKTNKTNKRVKKNKTNKRVKKNKIQRNNKMKQKGGVEQPTKYYESSEQADLGVENEAEALAIKKRRERQKQKDQETLKENLKLCEQKRKEDLQKITNWLEKNFSELGIK